MDSYKITMANKKKEYYKDYIKTVYIVPVYNKVSLLALLIVTITK